MFLHVNFYVSLRGKCSAAKVSLLCNTHYSNRESYVKALDKSMQPNVSILALAARMKSWMVRCLFAWRKQDCNEKKITSTSKCWTLRNAFWPIKFYLNFELVPNTMAPNTMRKCNASFRKGDEKAEREGGQEGREGCERSTRRRNQRQFLTSARFLFPVPFQVPATFMSSTPPPPPKMSLYLYRESPFLHKVVQIYFHYWQPKGQIIITLHHTIQCVGVKGIFKVLWYKHIHCYKS